MYTYMYVGEGGVFGKLLVGNLPNIVHELILISVKGMARYLYRFC